MWLHGNLGLLMNTTYPHWFESFHPAEKIQKASLPAPAQCLYPSQWFTPPRLLYLIDKHLTTAAGLGVCWHLKGPGRRGQAIGYGNRKLPRRQHWENSSCKSQSQNRHKGLPISTSGWAIGARRRVWSHASIYCIYGTDGSLSTCIRIWTCWQPRMIFFLAYRVFKP